MSREVKESEQDVVEMKKAIATGSAKESPSTSASTSNRVDNSMFKTTDVFTTFSTTNNMLLSGIHLNDSD